MSREAEGARAGAEAWAVRAARRVEARMAARPHWWAPLDRGMLRTARTDYRERQLSAAFTVNTVDAAGAPRRVAQARGSGRPLMILPGLYARVRVPLKEKTAFLIPQEAPGYDQRVAYVLTVNRENIFQCRHLGDKALQPVGESYPIKFAKVRFQGSIIS